VTLRLYYHDSSLRIFGATIVERADEGRRLYLDRSAFYPTSGGQPHDLGTLGGVAVIDVVDEDERVAHVLAEAYTGGDAVHGVIDWPRRWDYMQQHTGQHLLSGAFEELFGWATVSVHFGDALCTLELGTPAISPKQLQRAESLANALVTENRPVTVTYEDATAAAPRLRKAPDRAGTLRIVTIAGLDVSACGGTHVQATGEIGTILLRRVEKLRDNARVEFLCGARAIHRARKDYEALSDIAARLSAGVDEVAPLVQAQADEVKTLAGAHKKLVEEVAAYRARAQWESTPPDAGAVRRLRGGSFMTPDELRAFAFACAALPGTIFAGAFRTTRIIALAVSADLDANAGTLLKNELHKVGGRGGGSPRTAQGTVPADDQVDVVLTALLGSAISMA